MAGTDFILFWFFNVFWYLHRLQFYYCFFALCIRKCPLFFKKLLDWNIPIFILFSQLSGKFTQRQPFLKSNRWIWTQIITTLRFKPLELLNMLIVFFLEICINFSHLFFDIFSQNILNIDCSRGNRGSFNRFEDFRYFCLELFPIRSNIIVSILLIWLIWITIRKLNIWWKFAHTTTSAFYRVNTVFI